MFNGKYRIFKLENLAQTLVPTPSITHVKSENIRAKNSAKNGAESMAVHPYSGWSLKVYVTASESENIADNWMNG